MGGGSPTPSTTQPGGSSEEMLTVAPSLNRRRSLSLAVTSSERIPAAAARWNMVSARRNSPDSM